MNLTKYSHADWSESQIGLGGGSGQGLGRATSADSPLPTTTGQGMHSLRYPVLVVSFHLQENVSF